jgi:hypothetical protein
LKQVGFLLSILAISTPAIAQSRSVVLYKGGVTYRVGEGTAVSAAKGDYLQLDSNIGTVRVMSPTAYMWLSRLSSRSGGKQTVLVVRSGAVFARVRRFTSPTSYFGISDYIGRSVTARGTEFYVEVVDGKIVTIVESSKVQADNTKGVTMPLLSGQGAEVSEGGIRQFKVGYGLDVNQGKTQVFVDGRTNIFSGWIEPWLKILVDDQTISPGLNGYFKVRTRSHCYQVLHPFGMTRQVCPPGAARNNFGSH